MNHETYLLIMDEGEELAFTSLLNLCRSVKGAEKKYHSIRRKLLKKNTTKFNGYLIKKSGEAKEIKAYEIDGKIYTNLNKSKRTK